MLIESVSCIFTLSVKTISVPEHNPIIQQNIKQCNMYFIQYLLMLICVTITDTIC